MLALALVVLLATSRGRHNAESLGVEYTLSCVLNNVGCVTLILLVTVEIQEKMFRAAQAITQMTELRDSDAVRFIHGDFLKVILAPPCLTTEEKNVALLKEMLTLYDQLFGGCKF